MSKSLKVVAISISVGFIAFLLGNKIWPPAQDTPYMTPSQTFFLTLLFVIESFVTGVGVAFAIYGWSAVKRGLPRNQILAFLAYCSIIWVMVSWWPHENLHLHVGMHDMDGLLKIEYGFHLTLLLAGAVIAFYGYKVFRAHGIIKRR